MSCEKVKRKKCSPFTKDEEIRLLHAIYDERKFIENKETNKASNSEKDKAWERACLAFNANSLEFRSIEQLKGKFDNLKTKAKKEVAKEKSYMKGTGGGGHVPIANDPVIDLILKIINPKTVVGVINVFDNDSTRMEANNEDIQVITEPVTEYSIVHNMENDQVLCEQSNIFVQGENEDSKVITNLTVNSEASGSQTWNDYTPYKLRKPTSKKLRPAVVSSLGEAKEDYFKIMSLSIKEDMEWKRKTDCREEAKHQKEMELLELEIAIKKKLLEK